MPENWWLLEACFSLLEARVGGDCMKSHCGGLGPIEETENLGLALTGKD